MEILVIFNNNNLGCVMEWISVKEKLPEKGEIVQVTDGAFVHCGRYTDTDGGGRPMDDGFLTCEDEFYRTNHNITHWMPLPEPPSRELHNSNVKSK